MLSWKIFFTFETAKHPIKKQHPAKDAVFL